MVDIHAKLRKLLSERGWSEYKLAKNCGLSESTISNLFKRNTMPSLPTLEAICRGFNITLSQFFAEEEMVELSSELKELFDNFISLTPEQKKSIIHLMKSMNNQ